VDQLALKVNRGGFHDRDGHKVSVHHSFSREVDDFVLPGPTGAAIGVTFGILAIHENLDPSVQVRPVALKG
jgi:hypothetical protein